MPSRNRRLARSLLWVGAALASSAAAASPIDVPPGNQRESSLNARGFQIYDCLMAPSGSFTWTFKAPEATLFNREGATVAKHYAGPTWESTEDGSKVQGTRIASEPSSSVGAIPQLLLGATLLTPGKTFGNVTYIQRVKTVGGSAPTSGCDATTQGAELRVPYTAAYRFYERD
jgi:hypothetical protein